MALKKFTLLILGILLAALAAIFSLIPSGSFQTDTVMISRISNQLKHTWPHVSPGDFLNYPYHFSFVDESGNILFASSEQTSESMDEAIRENDIILDMEANDGTRGKLLIRTGINSLFTQRQKQLFAAIAVFAILTAASFLLYGIYLNQKLLHPFRKLQAFAGHIAAGNLDVPLAMDNGHLFGAFTESFDLMRDKLAEARKAEAIANKSKKELVASLSHDIKTPVTSIKLISELLQVTAPEEYRGKIETIYNKAEQIDRLVTNLFQSAMEELQQLEVRTGEFESPKLKQLFNDADYYGKLTCDPIPGCILKTDPLRLSQVIDNVINNSYKYANTEIHVSSSLTDAFLLVKIRDNGPGVREDELPHLFEKFYRGNAAGESRLEGSGLGLYLSGYLMERMDGEISCSNLPDGFLISLLIPLAD